MTTKTTEWAIDSFGVAVCPDCQTADEVDWYRDESDDGMYCESCERYIGEKPDWMTIRDQQAEIAALKEELRQARGG